MESSHWIIYLLIGKVVLFLWQEFPLPQPIEKFRTLKKLHECDLCAGFWVYGILAFFMGMSLLEVFDFKYILVVSEVITGGVISFIVHIFSIGWKEKFNNVVVI